MRTFVAEKLKLRLRDLRWIGIVLILAMLVLAAGAVTREPALASFSPALASGGNATSEHEAAIFESQLRSLGQEQTLSADLAKRVLTDADDRISDEFKVPAEIRNTVEFWFRIYAQYSSKNLVLFDEKHPEIVYEVLDFSELSVKARNQVVYEVVRNNTTERKIRAYKAAFARLARNPHPRKPGPEEKLILAALKGLPHKHSFPELARSFRTQTGQRDFVINGLAVAEDFIPKMETIFEGFALPKELVRLSLVESSFNVGVTSRVGAAGVWQFMPESAKEYLFVHQASRIDERLSPLKSTVAAAKLLKRNKRILKNWALAVTSYNHGMKTLRKVASRSTGEFRSVANMFTSCSRGKTGIGWASRNYFAEFIAMVHAEAYRDLLYNDLRKPTFRSLAVSELRKPMSLTTFALNEGLSLRELIDLNPDIRDFRAVLPARFILTVPSRHDDLSLLIGRSRFVQPPKLSGRSLTGGLAPSRKGRRG